jgi:PhnB protein
VRDPFDALRHESHAENPPPRFVLDLYRQLFGQGAQTMTIRTAVPCLVVPEIEAALAFYEKAFGAANVERHHTPDGTLVYASFGLGDARAGLAGAEGEHNRSPRQLGGSPVPIDLDVSDVDTFFARAVEAGAEVIFPVGDYGYGRGGRLSDPFGHIWIITTPH